MSVPSNDNYKIRGLLKKSTFESPTLHPLVGEIFHSTQSPEFSVKILADKIQEDATFTGMILQICKLPYYSGNTPIQNISQVIQRLGPMGTRAVAMQAYLDLEIYLSDNSWDSHLKQMKTYSVIIAQICRVIARYTAISADDVYMVGLLHRIGFAVGLNKLTSKGSDSLDEIWEALEMTHPIFGKMVLQDWGFSETIQDAVSQYGQAIVQGQPNLLCCAILVAEEIAKRFKFEVRPPRKPKVDALPMMRDNVAKAVRLLEINEEMMRKIYMDSHFVLGHGLKLNI
jgi:HD-like signal output (HDOD) protein